MDFNKIETGNPIVDSVVYYSKDLVFNSIAKNQVLADKYETLDSAKYADIYILCVRGLATFDMFNYTEEQLSYIGVQDDDLMTYYLQPELLSTELKKALLRKAQKDYIDNYIEPNDYYRQFNGLPPIDDAGIKLTEKVDDVDTSKYIHNMSNVEITILESKGILNQLRAQYPSAKYLNFLGANKLDPYFVRTIPKFGLIYIPTIYASDLRSRYIEYYENNRTYVLATMYNDSIKYGNDYYDNFIMIMIKILAFKDMIISVNDMIITRDLIDLKSIKYMFESNGITYFDDIPMRYQLAMLKNLNTLLTYKSSTQNIIDICSMFGFDNIEVFKYYILRDRKKDEDGNYLFDTTTELDSNGNTQVVEDYVNNFDLKFVKVPVDGILDNYIRDDDNYIPYKDMTKDDKYWNAGQDEDDIYKEVISKEFNAELSKYISIDVVYDMDTLTFEMCYFFNIFNDTVPGEDNLLIKVPGISSNYIKLSDAIYYLFALQYIQYGYEDTIASTSKTGVLSVYGFNFQADLSKIAQYLQDYHVSLEDLGLQSFILQEDQILTYNQLLNVYTTNKKCYDWIVKQMKNANDADIYNIYKKMFDALMVTNTSTEIFALPDGSIPETYTEYFMYYSSDIYNHITNIKSLSSAERDNAVGETIINILSAMEDFIGSDNFQYMFMNLPMAGEIIKGYIFKVINFYKSHTVQLKNINTIYKFDDWFQNSITCIDAMRSTISFTKHHSYDIDLTQMINAKYKMPDSLGIYDSIDISYGMTLNDKDTYDERLKSEYMFDDFYFVSQLQSRDNSAMMYSTKMINNTSFTKRDYIPLEDHVFITSSNI